MGKSLILLPPIHPSCYKDESPFGYLIRLAKLNKYESYRWLVNAGSFSQLNNFRKLFDEINSADWCGTGKALPIQKDVCHLPLNHLLSEFRYCPLCIKEFGYWKVTWHMKVIVACTVHNCWLVDRCPDCYGKIKSNAKELLQCTCGGDLGSANSEACPIEVIRMQRFIEGVDIDEINSYEGLINKSHNLALEVKSQIIIMLARHQSSGRTSKSGNSTKLIQLFSAIEVISSTAKAFFGAAEDFLNFIKKLDTKNSQSQFLLIKFYREFYEYCPQVCFDKYKIILEKYINENWQKAVNKRNSLFREETLKNHAWIPLQQACREFNISKSKIMRAITNNLIRSKKDITEKRSWILVHKNDVATLPTYLTDKMTALEASALLRVTKLQLKELVNAGYFKNATPPKKGYCSHWQFSRMELRGFIDQFTSQACVLDEDFISLPNVLQKYGGQLDDPLIELLSAIRKRELIVKRSTSSMGIGDLMIQRESLIDWYKNKRKISEKLTVPIVARMLCLQQEFTYQLTHFGFLETTAVSDKIEKWITQDQLERFQEDYVLLSKLSKATGLTSKHLMDYLSSREIFPVDEQQNYKLRQKLYLRHEINKVQLIKDSIGLKTEWDE